ncbi:MAG: transposase [Solobacterium sp.]|nr:transposase [Solobacterium sp.]
MPRISRTDDNLFAFPKGAFLRNEKYVYVNVSNNYVSSSRRVTSGKGYTGHDSVCIGVLQNPKDKNNKMLYANNKYKELFTEQELPDPPLFADSISVGFNGWMAKVMESSGLSADLNEAFKDEEHVRLVLDLASYMISRESAVMQHFPAWAREHMLFSEDVSSDTTIGRFIRDTLSVSKIKLFRELWFKRNIGDGRVYLCYDSTNVNCQARGVMIVQKGHAKDDATLPQVNTDYVVRQSDGLPLTYLHSPGSVTDIAQAQEMIEFIREAKKLTGIDVVICLICDRGYISEKNVKDMDNSGITYLLMLRSNFTLYKNLADQVIDTIKTYRNEISCDDNDEKYGVTVECTLYEGGPVCYAHIIWSNERYRNERGNAKETIARERRKLENFIQSSKKKSLEEKELEWVPKYFILKTEPGTPKEEIQKKRGRGTGTITVKKPTVRLVGYEDNEEAINREIMKAGLMILISREEMTAETALHEYGKRDCVEKVFQALKSHMGMDKIGVTTEEAMHGKGLIWFVASILHALLFTGTSELRISDKKHYTVPAMVDQLEAIKADKDLRTGNYKRRYKVTRTQSRILSQFGMNEKDIDDRIGQLD